MPSRRSPIVLSLVLLGGCAAPPVLLHDGLQGQTPAATIEAAEARRYFDQGLMLCWGFNHDEAVRSFEEAARLDPAAAMPWWGMAFALGPNINDPVIAPERALRAHRAARRAVELAPATSELEQALIAAMAERYADPPPDDRSGLDEAYAAAMRDVWQRFPGSADAGTLFADSLMLLSNKWRQWPVDGDRGPHTAEFVEVLERVLAGNPDHAGAHHFYIHAVEASDRPERALPSADRLLSLVPGSGHLLHMPSHIYIRVGEYPQAIEANRLAVEADDRFFADAVKQGRYHLYRAHNHHFLIWAAMFQGAREKALAYAREMVRKLPGGPEGEELPRSSEPFLFVPVHALVRFGMWEEVLAEPRPAEHYAIAVALWHHARAIACANLGRPAEADAEGEAFERVAATIPESRTVRRASVGTILGIARHMMRGEVLFKRGEQEQAFAELRRAVELEDTLPYSEPPGWMQPIRHALGALLLEAGNPGEAEAVYRADLAQHAENGWSLHGLAESLRALGRHEEAAAVEARFRVAWKDADVEIHASCYCRSSG